MRKLLARFKNNQAGATAIEYGLIAALMSVVVIGVFGTLGTSFTEAFGTIGDTLTGATGAGGE